MSVFVPKSVKAKMQNDLSRGGDDRLDSLESQEVDASSEVSI